MIRLSIRSTTNRSGFANDETKTRQPDKSALRGYGQGTPEPHRLNICRLNTGCGETENGQTGRAHECQHICRFFRRFDVLIGKANLPSIISTCTERHDRLMIRPRAGRTAPAWDVCRASAVQAFSRTFWPFDQKRSAGRQVSPSPR